LMFRKYLIRAHILLECYNYTMLACTNLIKVNGIDEEKAPQEKSYRAKEFKNSSSQEVRKSGSGEEYAKF
jgi:hypothetical protein